MPAACSPLVSCRIDIEPLRVHDLPEPGCDLVGLRESVEARLVGRPRRLDDDPFGRDEELQQFPPPRRAGAEDDGAAHAGVYGLEKSSRSWE